MLLKDCIYFVGVILSLMSIPTLIYSIKNKRRNISKCIIAIDFIYIIYLFVDIIILPDKFCIPLGLEILLIYLLAIISGLLYVISIVYNFNKLKKLDICDKTNKVVVISLILFILPLVCIYTSFFWNKHIINSSEIILVYYSRGNGGIGDGETFAYAIGKNHCEQFDLGIDIYGKDLKKFLPSNAIEITNINDLENYKITLNNDSIVIEKNKQYIYKKKHKKNYINVELKKCYLNINN